MRVPVTRYLVLGALLCAALCLSVGNIACSSSDSPVNVPIDPPQEDPGFTSGKDIHGVDHNPLDGENGDQ